MEKSEVEVFVWWDGKGVFSATPLRSYLKRLKQKNGVFQNFESDKDEKHSEKTGRFY